MARKPVPVGATAPEPAASPETIQPEPAASVDATQSEPAASPETPPAPKDAVEVRILLAQCGHRPNTVVTLSSEEAMAAVLAGWADDDPAAVAYARSLTE